MADAADQPEDETQVKGLGIEASTAVPEQETAAVAPTPSPQPKTLGGFILEDDEDEEGVAQQETAAADLSGSPNVDRGSSTTPQRSVTKSPNNAHPPNNVHASAQEQESLSHDPTSASDPSQSASVFPAVPFDGASDNMTNADHIPPAAASPAPVAAASAQSPKSLPKARLPHDRVGILEDRIKEDPRGDVDAWISLINEHKRRNKVADVRSSYERFFKVFPQAAAQWTDYANLELEQNNFYEAEQIFNKSLLSIPNVDLWTTYLNYIRRRNNLSADSTGQARKIVSDAYDFVLNQIGMDKDAGPLWQDYIQFLRSGPGNIGGTGWQDQQKMDVLRKAYQRAICIPTQAVNALWKDYDSFEMGLNKMTGRKFLQEKSPSYMTARSSNTNLQNITRELDRSSLPTLPPALGFEGDVEYMKQVEIWNRWVNWEKEDPLVLKDEDEDAYKGRILYVFKHAVISLRFWPEMWFSAAEFCFDNGLDSEGDKFLQQGAAANPESCLLGFRLADRVEYTTSNDEGEEGIKRRGAMVREPYDKVLDALYNLINQTKERESQTISRIKENFAQQQAQANAQAKEDEDEDEEDGKPGAEVPDAQLKLQVEAIQRFNSAQVKLLSKTISYAWVALMRAMRRVQGKGKPNDVIGGSRQIFADARKRGRITSEVYMASALIEYHCYKDPAATKIFERGFRLFPEDEQFAMEYLKHLIAINDVTNARAVFETAATKLAAKAELLPRAKPLYQFFHEYEAQYGELSQVKKLEKRISELFPEDPKLLLFSQRFAVPGFDPCAIRPLISQTAQAKPKSMIPSVEQPPAPQSVVDSPRPGTATVTLPAPPVGNSPKRPLEESDNESLPPRKVARAESPLKGAAGRRLDAAKRTALRNEMNQSGGQVSAGPAQAAPMLPRDVMFLLSIIPRAEMYTQHRLDPQKMVELLRNVDLSRADLTKRNAGGQAAPAPPPTMNGTPQQMQQAYGGYAPPSSMYGYGI